jgi:hypothetical protein
MYYSSLAYSDRLPRSRTYGVCIYLRSSSTHIAGTGRGVRVDTGAVPSPAAAHMYGRQRTAGRQPARAPWHVYVVPRASGLSND